MLTGAPLFKECTCLESCRYCAVELTLNVTCTSNQTMHITTNHLMVTPPNSYRNGFGDEGEPGEELSKRPEKFGWPAGKGVTLFLIIVEIQAVTYNDFGR